MLVLIFEGANRNVFTKRLYITLWTLVQIDVENISPSKKNVILYSVCPHRLIIWIISSHLKRLSTDVRLFVYLQAEHCFRSWTMNNDNEYGNRITIFQTGKPHFSVIFLSMWQLIWSMGNNFWNINIFELESQFFWGKPDKWPDSLIHFCK